MVQNKSVLYLTSEVISDAGGVSKKILQQVHALRRLGYAVDLVSRTDKKILINDVSVAEFDSGLLLRVDYYNTLFHYLSNVQNDTYDFVYVRNSNWAIPFGYLKVFMLLSQRAKVILEIPTYPYKGEIKSISRAIVSFFYSVLRSQISKFIDLIVYMGRNAGQDIWGVKSLPISNGFDPYSVDLANNNLCCSKYLNELNFIGVARLTYWHGYDRLIKGIYEYKKRYNDLNINFFVIGDGYKTLRSLQLLVEKLSLSDNVHFLGPLCGEDLNDVFQKSHIGVDSLGRHRTGVVENSSLKSKEYIARGIPLIKSHYDSDLVDLNFVYDLPPNDQSIDLPQIIDWYSHLNASSSEIRDYAFARFLWEHKFEKIFQEISV